MKTIEQVQQFISDYTDAMYLANTGLHDHDRTKEQHEQNIDHLKTFYAPIQQYWHTQIFSQRHIQYDTREESQEQLDMIIKQKIFLIRKYEGATFGKALRPDNDTIFCCYLSSDDVHAGDTAYLSNVAVGYCDGELRILSIRLLDSDMLHQHKQLVWTYLRNSKEVEDGIWIKDNGKWVETLRVNEPEVALWITDYHRNHTD